MERLRRPVPVWMLLVGILFAASVATAIVVGPSYLGPKPDFSLRPDQTSQHVFAGFISYQSSLDFKIGVTSVNGFSGIVSFSAPAPAGLSVHVREQRGPNPVAILGRNDTIDVSVYASNFGNYTLTVTGSIGELSHSVILMVIAQTITFIANPDPILIPSTGSVNGTMTLTGVNGFSGNVALGGRPGSLGAGASVNCFSAVSRNSTCDRNLRQL